MGQNQNQQIGSNQPVIAEGKPVYELPFYLVQMLCPHYRIFNPRLNKEWADNLKREQDGSLRDKFPRHENPIAAQFVTAQMVEDSFWIEADANGDLATDDPILAAYALRAAQKLNPKADLHPFSKKLTEEDHKRASEKFNIPGPRKYNLKPKAEIKIRGFNTP
jgi:hypothetical protein